MTLQAAEKRGTGGEFAEKLPSGAKARVDSTPLTARLKPCPFKAMSFSATCKVVPFQKLGYETRSKMFFALWWNNPRLLQFYAIAALPVFANKGATCEQAF
jgi:hypothetical protein